MIALLLCSLTFAQAPAVPAGEPMTVTIPPASAEATPTGTLPQFVWTTGEVKLKRWPDAEVVSATLAPDRKVEVVYEDGDWVRVRDVLNFGWAPRGSLSATEPAPAGEGGPGEPAPGP